MAKGNDQLNERTLFDYWLVVYERKLAIVVVTVSAIALALGLSLYLPPIYEAKTIFYVPSQMVQPLIEQGAVAPAPSGAKNEAQAYVKVLKGNKIQNRVRQKFPQQNLAKLGRDVDFSTSREGMITVYVRNRDPQLAAAIATTYIEVFDEFNEANAESRVGYSISANESQVNAFITALNKAQALRREFREKHAIASLPTELDGLVKQRQAFQQDLEAARVALAENEGRIESVKAQLAKEARIYVPTELVVSSPVVESIRKTLAELEIALAGKEVVLSEDHPELLALREQYAQAKGRLQEEITRIMRSRSKMPHSTHETLRQTVINLVVEKNGITARMAGLKSAITMLDQKISALPGMSEEAQRLDQDVQRNSELLTEAMKHGEALRMQVLRNYRSTVVVETAFPPEDPAFPDPLINLCVALPLGLLGGIMYAFFLDYIEGLRRVRTLRELEIEEWLQTPS
jgi:uncharacterized protein involved in exopolysaccharide biosynthesis